MTVARDRARADPWPAPRARGPVGRRLAARQQVADQPGARARRAGGRALPRPSRAAVARHPADGRSAGLARGPHRQPAATTGPSPPARSPAAPTSTAAWPGPSCGSCRRWPAWPPERSPSTATRTCGPARSARCSSRCAASGVEIDGDGVPVHGARDGRGARRPRGDRRVRVVAVRVGAAAGRRPVRPGGRRAPRRQADALAPPRRHDRRDAARAWRRGRRRRRRPLGRRARPGPRRRRRHRARPLQRGALPRAGRGVGRLGHRPRLARADHAGG